MKEASKNEEVIEKSFNIKQKNVLRVKTDRIAKFTINFELEILKNNKNQTLLYNYSVAEIESMQLAAKGPKKIVIDLKNVNKNVIILTIFIRKKINS